MFCNGILFCDGYRKIDSIVRDRKAQVVNRLTPPISRLFFQIVLYTTVADIAQYLRYRLSMKVFSMAITTSSP